MPTKSLSLTLLAVLLATSVGCIGISKNTDRFLNPPTSGMTEVEMVMQFGAPDFSTRSGDKAVYVYKIIDRAYYIVFGYADDLDMVVVLEGGKVKEVKKLKAGTGMAILQPNTWPSN